MTESEMGEQFTDYVGGPQVQQHGERGSDPFASYDDATQGEAAQGSAAYHQAQARAQQAADLAGSHQGTVNGDPSAAEAREQSLVMWRDGFTAGKRAADLAHTEDVMSALRFQCVQLAANHVPHHDVVRYAGELVGYVLGHDRQKA